MSLSTEIAGRADVIIAGGGVMGSATAFFARQLGLSVILLERDLVGQYASGTNFGNVRRQGRFLPQLPLANRSRELWGRLPQLLGEDVEFVAGGHVRVSFKEEDSQRLEKYAEDCKPYGLDLELYSGRRASERFPMLSPDVNLASFSPLDGHANPRLAAPAFARAARRAGATVLERTEVLNISKNSEDFVVETTGGQRFVAPQLQISVGAWARKVAASFGEDLPLVARAPQMAVTEPVPYRIYPVIGYASWVEEEGVYLRQVERGNIVFGGGRRSTVDLVAKRARLDPLNTLRQMPHMERLLPDFARLRIIRTWAGIESYTDDDIPVMGASRLVPGLFYAFGFCGAGFQLGPGVGATMADLLATGQTEIPLAPFNIARFTPAAVA
ncbi:NAD(P)/FAD-dependent oxidoreductase [Acetobacter conturbans]|uniref:FAD-dependent oxidoreductase n=1 Tax=Acetobacter conturbans TaxID=1737472 RepID=A0ABX0JUD4_9PROT|nr:FAD-binding oxidoreductase [Acetobacter conturbans]NHN87106.1 FAD-dependent oxidoreductase [Acetobacter conturbans]